MFGRACLVGLLVIGCTHGGGAPSPAAPAPAAAPEPIDGGGPGQAALGHKGHDEPGGVTPWGVVVLGGTTEVKAALAAIGAGQAQPPDLAAPLNIGPALWALLVKLDPALAQAGTPSTNALPHRTGAKQSLEVRSFAHEPELAALLRSPGFRKIGRAFGQANVREATAAERELFYLLVPFEVAGHAVTIAERDADRLVVFLDDKRRPVWLDVLSAYAAGGP